MKNEKSVKKFVSYLHTVVKKLSGLRTRMAISYVCVSLLIVLLLELLLFVGIYFALTGSPLVDDLLVNMAQRTAHIYVLESAMQSASTALDPHITFQPGHPSSLGVLEDHASKSGNPTSSYLVEEFFQERVPFIDSSTPPSQVTAFALIIAPDGRVLASSYPTRYPVSTSVAQLLPHQGQLLSWAQTGKSGNITIDTADEDIAATAQTIVGRDQKPLGVVYVQIASGLAKNQLFSDFLWTWLRTGLPWLLFMIPIGTIFGVLTTGGLVRRIRRLATTTTEFASGQYEQRIRVSGKDEVGQLEQSFNHMAEQLVESMAQRQLLIEENARREERARIEQEMRTARFIQQSLLPKEVPTLPGWHIVPYYQPAREVGGDFYDFLSLEDGRLGIVIGDATDKGVPAALMMATTHTMLRTAVQTAASSPGSVLARVNDLLYAETPERMFVTCFYAILDPSSGKLCYANAGQDLPYLRHGSDVSELSARGMPLGMMPGMSYEEHEVLLDYGDSILFYSDGLVEIHNSKREMFGFPRLQTLLSQHSDSASLIDFLLNEKQRFTGEESEQEDDVTLLTLQRTSERLPMNEQPSTQDTPTLLAEWSIESKPGNEQLAMERVAEVVQLLQLPPARLANLKTAVAEAVMNAMEHGNHYQADVPVDIQVLTSKTALAIRIRDQGGSKPIPEANEPDLEAKLAGLQTPRGWGLFLMKNMVDDINISSDETHHTIELIMYREGESHATS